MTRRTTIIQGHPDGQRRHFEHALAEAYAKGAAAGGHEVTSIEVTKLDFPFLRTKEEFETGTPPACIRDAQVAIQRADHLLILYPLWLGTMPAIMNAFCEQVFRPDFTLTPGEDGQMPRQRLTGKSARIVVTMGMPAFFYHWYFRAHSLRCLERNILKFAGIRPVRESLIGKVERMAEAERERWLEKMEELGRAAR